MARRIFLILAIGVLSGLGGCSDTKTSEGQGQLRCEKAAADICREVYPGVFKVDVVAACTGPGERVEEENEVPMSFCEPCRDKQATVRAEMDQLLADGARCETDEDCAVMHLAPTCASACGGALNRSFDVERYDALVEEWNACTLCRVDACQESSSLAPPRCAKGQCVVSPSSR